ncbi:branched-chain amino acid transport [Aureimonas sp. SA4125]|uniref:AzlD family protein n=1 Tax=Aureimonas sp. SA4125 TaxID=2826993 RepID=UPI001CC58CC4|nr:AzlD domain-containing protein [Aureimonas sp. SA4125]BDA85572.1 branched-chain amino acid transport [Aureimonas sp. SA4125]
MSDVWQIILLGAVLTYVTRFAGHVVLTRIERIPPRVEAALDAVPAAVLATIVAPVLVTGDWPERVVIVICAFLCLRLPVIATVAIGVALVALSRVMGL